MQTQNYLSDAEEQIIAKMLKDHRLTITDKLSCFNVKRCADCPLEQSYHDCITLRGIYAQKYHPELYI